MATEDVKYKCEVYFMYTLHACNIHYTGFLWNGRGHIPLPHHAPLGVALCAHATSHNIVSSTFPPVDIHVLYTIIQIQIKI